MKHILLLFMMSAPAAAFAQDEFRFKDVRDLGKDIAWGALSADGKRALLATRNNRSPRFSFRVVEIDSGKATITHDADVNMDDFLPGLIRPECFSSDGTRVILPWRSAERAPDQWGGGGILIVRDGAKTNHGVAHSRSTTWFGAWSKDDRHVYFIEAGHRKDVGYSIRKMTDGQFYETLHENSARLACHLRPSPDGQRLAFCDFPGRDDEVRLVVLTLGDKKAVESEPFRCDDMGADGVMPLHWESDRSIVFHRSPPEARAPGTPERIQAWRYDVEKRSMTAMNAEGTKPFFVTAPAGDGRWLAGRQEGNKLEGMVVLPGGRTVSLPASNLAISSGAGWWLVMDLGNRSLFQARPEWKN